MLRHGTTDLDVVEVERLYLHASWLSFVLGLRLALFLCLLLHRRGSHLVYDLARARLLAVVSTSSICIVGQNVKSSINTSESKNTGICDMVHDDVVVILTVAVRVAGLEELVSFGVEEAHRFRLERLLGHVFGGELLCLQHPIGPVSPPRCL